MGWKQDWVNAWINDTYKGTDTASVGGGNLIIARKVEFASPGTVRIDETSSSGAVIVETLNDPVSSGEAITQPLDETDLMTSTAYGNTEVYLAIRWRGSKPDRYLSAPVSNPIELENPQSMALVVLAPLPKLFKRKRYSYRIAVNGHCLFAVESSMNYTIDKKLQIGPGYQY